MFKKGSSFAHYSKTLCWVVSFIWLLLSIAAFSSDSESANLDGFLWLVGVFAFAIAAMYLSRNPEA